MRLSLSGQNRAGRTYRALLASIIFCGCVVVLGGCSTIPDAKGALVDARTGAPVSEAWVWALGRGDGGFPLYKSVQCKSYSIVRTDSRGVFSLPMPAHTASIYAFHPGYELDERLDSVFEEGRSRFLQTGIVNHRYSRVPGRPDTRYPHALVQDGYIPLPPAPLTSDQVSHEYPPTLENVVPGTGQLPLFPIWRQGEAPTFEDDANRQRQLQLESSPGSCWFGSEAVHGTTPQLLDALREAMRKR